jgi:hypothetical protein
MRRATRWIALGSALALVAGAAGSAGADVLVAPMQTYYDNSGGVLADPVALPGGATSLRFSVTGFVITAGGGPQLSPDGLDSAGNAEFNFSNVSFGAPTYKGVSIGRTTGTDPALFGIFFSPSFVGTAPDSANFRSDASPDLRTMLTYSPALNQPFFIGDGFTGNNAFGAPVSGTQQTFNIPTGATELLLGIGADPVLGDNSGPGFTVKIAPNAVPEPSSLVTVTIGLALSLGYRRRRRKAKPAAA